MSATGADPQSERTLPRESQAWRLVRRTLPLGKSIGWLGYLISIGLIASWIIAVFFGASLFFLMPRSATLVTGSSADGDRFNAADAATPWLLQSTDKLHRLAAPAPFEPGQSTGRTRLVNDGAIVGPESRNTVEANQRLIPAEPTDTRTIAEPQNQALSVAASSEEPSPTPPPDPAAAAAGSPATAQAPQPEKSPARRNHKPMANTANKASSSHPPLQAIQDVLQRHAGLLK